MAYTKDFPDPRAKPFPHKHKLEMERNDLDGTILFAFGDKSITLPTFEVEDLHRNAGSDANFENIIIGLIYEKSKEKILVEHDVHRHVVRLSLGDMNMEMSIQEFINIKQQAHSKSDFEAHITNLIERRFGTDHDDATDAFSYITDYFNDRNRYPPEDRWKAVPWDKFHSKGKESDIIMANKFLPFIVEKSTPLHIYQTLLSRSKGMNYGLIASIFRMVLGVGISDLRKYVNTLPELPLEKLYQELLDHYSTYRTDDELMKVFINLHEYMKPEDMDRMDPDLAEFEPKDILIFFMVLAQADMVADYSTIPFGKVIVHTDKVLANIPEYIEFSDTGEEMYFKNADDLKAFIVYHSMIAEKALDRPIQAKFVQKKQEDGNAPF